MRYPIRNVMDIGQINRLSAEGANVLILNLPNLTFHVEKITFVHIPILIGTNQIMVIIMKN